MRTKPNVEDVALIFEGGGMRGSLTSGVVVALLEADVHLNWVVGVSAGTSHLINYLSRDAWRARASFVDFAGEPNFGSLRTWVRGRGLFNSEFIYEQSSGPGQPLPLDWETFQDNPAARRIVAFRADDGQQVVWTEDDIHSLHDLGWRARASSTIPVMMPAVRRAEGTYFDGALGTSGGIALDVAQADGFTKFLIVLSQPRGYVRGPVGNSVFYRRFFRQYPAAARSVATRHLRYNAVREEIWELEKAGQAIVFAPEVMPVTNTERNIAKLAASYELGLNQARAQMPAWKEFLGL